MANEVSLDTAYRPSEDIVAREIQGELVIVPLVSGIGDMEDELFTLNETARCIWDRLDGQRPLRGVAQDLAGQFRATAGEIETDVVGLVAELVRRGMLVEAARV